MANFEELMDVVESTRLSREYDKKYEELREKHIEIQDKIKRLQTTQNKLSEDSSPSVRKKLKEQISAAYDELDKIASERKNIMGVKGDPNLYSPLSSINYGNMAGKDKSYKYEVYKQSGKNTSKKLKDKYYSKGKSPEDRKPGRYATESVNELKLEIYESCRTGEITEDERDLLLNMF